MLRLDLAYIRATGPAGASPLEGARVEGRPDLSARPQEVADLVAPWLTEGESSKAFTLPHPVTGELLHATRIALSLEAHSGAVIVASRRMDFPTSFERFLLQSTVTQGNVALHNASLMAALRESNRLTDQALQQAEAAWAAAETANRAKDELNQALEQRVVERTSQLTAANEELRKEVLERRRAEEQLRQSEARWRAVFENSPIGIALEEPSGCFLAANSAYQTMLGYSEDELRALTFLDITHEDDREGNWKLFTELLEGQRQSFAIEKRYRRKDGDVIWVTVNVSLVSGTEASARFTMAIVEDITARKQAEQVRSYLAAIVESSEDAIVSVDPEGLITSWNKAAEQISGYGAPEVVGRPISVWIPPVKQREEAHILERVKQGERVERYETVRSTRDGQPVDVSLTISPIRDPEGRIIGSSRIIRDITERKEAERLRQREADLQAADRAKDEFLALLSHELRSPLNAIAGWLNILRAKKGDVALAGRAVETIERNTRLLAKLVDDLLDSSRIVAGRLQIARQPVDVVPLVEAVLETMRPAAVEKGVALESVLDPWSGVVLGDPARLHQVVANLVANAIKFTPPGGFVEVRAQGGTSQVQITVSDTGQGIRPEFLPYVFDRFRQADTSTTRTHGGLGLGLAIVRHLVELHGGTVDAESPGEGQGARFIVRLPLLKHPDQPLPA
jgi:PAS domain S-box-containing protein